METLCSLQDLAEAIPDGAVLAIPPDDSGVSIAATLALIRRSARDLHLVCVPTSGLQAEILIGAGAVATLETSAVTLGEFGPAHRFIDALRKEFVDIAISAAGKVIKETLDKEKHRKLIEETLQQSAVLKKN